MNSSPTVPAPEPRSDVRAKLELVLHSRTIRFSLWALILIQCLGVAWKLPPWIAGDSPSYLELAGNLARGFYGEVLENRIQPDVLRPPGYPLILYFLLSVCHLSKAAVIALQLGLYVSTLGLIDRFLIARGIPTNPFLLLAAIYPFGAIYSAGFMTEPWAMLGFTIVALSLAKSEMTLVRAAVCGLIAGGLGLLRTDLLPVPLLFSGIIALRALRGRIPRASGFSSAALALVAAAVMLVPYAAWNQAKFGKFSPSPMAAAVGSSLYSAYWQERLSNDTLSAFYSGRITQPLVDSGYLSEVTALNKSFGAPPLAAPVNPVAYPNNATRVTTNIVFGKAALDHFKREPSLYLKHVAKNVWYLWNTSEYPGIPWFVVLFLQISSGLVLLLGMSFAALNIWLGRGAFGLPRSLTLTLLYPFLLHVPLHLEARYTAVARPLLLMFAGIMLVVIARHLSGARGSAISARS